MMITIIINITLIEIRFYQNKIGDDGAIAIAEALKENNTLSSIK